MRLKHAFFAGALFASALCQNARAEDSAWVSIIKDGIPNNWTGYFQKLGVGGANETWKMTPEGWLHVDIQVNFATSGFGHLFYTKKKLSYYMVRAEYRFPANTFGPGWGQGWNRENNGLMLHGQHPSAMGGLEFPTSIEVQLLGKNNEQNSQLKSQGFKYASTANMCSPQTFIAYDGNANYTNHCTNSVYPAAWKNTDIPFEDPDGWSDVTVRVLADSLVQHFIHGTKVMEYTRLRLDNGTPLKEGYLSIQAEGTSTQFRKLEILELVGCMDQTKPAYRTYFVKNDPAACTALDVARGASDAPSWRLLTRAGGHDIVATGPVTAQILSLDGKVEAEVRGSGRVSLPSGHSGLRLVRVFAEGRVATVKAALP